MGDISRDDKVPRLRMPTKRKTGVKSSLLFLGDAPFILCPEGISTASSPHCGEALHSPEHSCPPLKIESHLPEEGIEKVSKDLRETSPSGVILQVGQPEVLFHDITDLGDCPVPRFLTGSQRRPPRPLAHDSVLDVVHPEEIPVRLPEVPFVGKHGPDRIGGMATGGHTSGKMLAVMDGGRCHVRCQDEPVPDIHRGVFLHPEMGYSVPDGPVGIDIPGELQGIPLPIPFPFRGILKGSLLFQFLLPDEATGRLNQAGIDSDPLVDAQTPAGKLEQNGVVDLRHGVLLQPAPKPGKGRMVRRRAVQRQPKETLEGKPVVDLCFQLRVRIDPEPLLQKQCLQEHERRIGIGLLDTSADRVMFQKDFLDPGPVDDRIDLLHPLKGAVVFHGTTQGDIGKRVVWIHPFVAHHVLQAGILEEP